MYVQTTDICIYVGMYKWKEMGTHELQKNVTWTTELGAYELKKQLRVTSTDLSRI
jgi:hypothetical protein